MGPLPRRLRRHECDRECHHDARKCGAASGAVGRATATTAGAAGGGAGARERTRRRIGDGQVRCAGSRHARGPASAGAAGTAGRRLRQGERAAGRRPVIGDRGGSAVAVVRHRGELSDRLHRAHLVVRPHHADHGDLLGSLRDRESGERDQRKVCLITGTAVRPLRSHADDER